MLAQESFWYYVGRAVVVAVALAAIATIGVSIRWAGRWMRRAVLADLRDSVREVMAPAITQLRKGQSDLKDQMTELREENTEQHRQMRERLHDLEEPKEP